MPHSDFDFFSLYIKVQSKIGEVTKKKNPTYFEVEKSEHSNTVKLKPFHSPVYLSLCALPLPSALTSQCLFQS